MDFVIKGHDKINTVQTAIQIFYPNLNYKRQEKIPDTGLSVLSCLSDGFIISEFYSDGKLIVSNTVHAGNTEKELKRNIKFCIYDMLKKIVPLKTPWGIMTGIRPAKTAGELINSGMTETEAVDYLQSFYCASKEKAELAISVYKQERSILSSNNGKDTGLYIGIPFCPTRCLYCSFTSYPIKQYSKYIGLYLQCLVKEMDYAVEFLKGRTLESIYIGGGTPTSVDASSLNYLLENIKRRFNIENLKEFTVEAGRPDTITREKLQVLKKNNVSRISINPQTMSDKTLKLIGRSHSKQQFLEAFSLARDEGFRHINVDLILGLPEESADDVRSTFEQIERLNPESVTVHTLTVKRASRLKEELESRQLASMDLVEEMIEISADAACHMGLSPYYMYRQKNSLGNFENVGYAKQGHEGIYNVQIMEEKQTILALGAGSTSKFVNFETGRIERAFNVKDVEGYTQRIDEMIDRKRNLENIL